MIHKNPGRSCALRSWLWFMIQCLMSCVRHVSMSMSWYFESLIIPCVCVLCLVSYALSFCVLCSVSVSCVLITWLYIMFVSMHVYVLCSERWTCSVFCVLCTMFWVVNHCVLFLFLCLTEFLCSACVLCHPVPLLYSYVLLNYYVLCLQISCFSFPVPVPMFYVVIVSGVRVLRFHCSCSYVLLSSYVFMSCVLRFYCIICFTTTIYRQYIFTILYCSIISYYNYNHVLLSYYVLLFYCVLLFWLCSVIVSVNDCVT